MSRRWLAAVAAGLLVVLYLVSWTVYARLHLPPQRYDQLPPGAVASKLGAEFSLVELSQSLVLTGLYDRSVAAPPGAVWVVARLDVTRRAEVQNFNCQLVLVAADGRTWEPASSTTVSREVEACAREAPLGQTTPIETIFQVPESDANRLVGVAVPQNTAGRDPVLTRRG